jgi:glycosyltransferase involved in cell wall biosynthesis
LREEISVVLPAYNAGPFIKDSLLSLKNQSLAPKEIILVNDGSTDNTTQIASSLELDNLKIISFESNKGIVHALNEGIKVAQGNYIARMDADDISLPQRFEKQLEFLKSNQLDLCSSWILNKRNNTETIFRFPKAFELYTMLPLVSTIAHAAAMAKSNFFKDNPYNPDYEMIEDFELWNRTASQYRFDNIQEVLYSRNYHPQARTLENQTTHRRRHLEHSKILFNRLNCDLNIADLEVLRFLHDSSLNDLSWSDQKIFSFLNSIHSNNPECTNQGKEILGIIAYKVMLKRGCYRLWKNSRFYDLYNPGDFNKNTLIKKWLKRFIQ